jgi:hypothetical protein
MTTRTCLIMPVEQTVTKSYDQRPVIIQSAYK